VTGQLTHGRSLTGLAWWKLLLIALQHWLQDRTNFVPWSMKIMGRNEFAAEPLAP
jgi:hypothetical protein